MTTCRFNESYVPGRVLLSIAPPHSRTIYMVLLCTVLTLWGSVTCLFCCPCCPGARCLTRLESRYGAWPPPHRRIREGGEGQDTPTVETPMSSEGSPTPID